MDDNNKPNLEREIKSLQEQIDFKRKHLEKQSEELGYLEQNIEILYHDIFQKNNQIQAIEDEEKVQFKDDQQKKDFDEQMKLEQQDQLLKTKKAKTSEKSRQLVEQYYLNKHKAHSEKLSNQQVKLEVQSIKIMYLKQDPSEYLQKENRNSTTISFSVQTFSINKLTLMKDLFESATEYFQVLKAKRDEYVLTDTNFNDLSLLYDFPAESYFSSQKETSLYAELYLKPRFTTQTVLLDKQQESIQLGDGVNSLSTTVDTERKNLLTIFSNFEKVFSGIQLYSTQAKDDYNMTLLQNIKNRFWLNMFHMVLYIALIALLISILQQNIDPNLNDIKANSVYFLETFAGINDPIQDSSFFQKNLNGFSRKFKYANSTDTTTNFIGNPKTQSFPLFSNYVSLGAVRIVLKKTKVKACDQFIYYQMTDDEIASFSCSQPVISSSTETTQTIDGLKWTSSSVNGLDTVQAFLGTYSTGGYKLDFDPYMTNEQTYTSTVNEYDNYIDFQTKAAIIYGCFYDINRNKFLSVYYIVDISTAGIYIENQDVYYFPLFYKSNMTSSQKQVYNTNIACLVLISLILVITLFVNADRAYQTYKLNKTHKLNMKTRDIFFKLLSIQMTVEAMILAFFVVAYIFVYDVPDIPFSDLIKTQYPNFINIHKYGYQQNIGHQLQALSLILLVLFLCINIPINYEIQNFQKMIQNSVGPLVVVTLLIFTLICSLALILQRVFGPYIVEFTTYETAFYETIFVYFFGDYQIQQAMWDKNLALSLVLIGIIIIMLFYGGIALFNSILFEKYRLVSTKLSSTEQIDVAEKFNEKLKNLKSFSCWKCFKKSGQPSKPKGKKKAPPKS